ARAAAESAAGISSPSRVFAEMGDELAAGLVVGLDRSTAQVEAASAVLMSNVVAAGEASVVAAGQPAVGGDAGDVVIHNVNVTVPSGSTPAQAREIGREAGRGFMDVLSARRVRAAARSI